MPTSLKTGGGLPIDFISVINTSEEVFTASDGSIWLRSGIISDDTNLYPKASVNPAAFFDNFFSFASEFTDPECVVRTDNYFWVVSQNGGNSQAYQYDSNGNYNSVSTSLTSFNGRPMDDLEWDAVNARIWGLGTKSSSTKHLTEFDENFNKLNEYDLAATVAVNSETFLLDGDDLWLYVYDNPTGTVYRYNKSGVYQNESVDLNPDTVGFGRAYITKYDGSFWLLNTGDSKVYRFTLDWEYTGLSFGVSDTSNLSVPRGLTREIDGSSLWIVGDDQNIVSEFKKYIGVAFTVIDTDTQKPLFVRVG